MKFSMVVILMDAIDRSLKVNRENDLPFGGVQMLFVGEVPIVTYSLKKF